MSALPPAPHAGGVPLDVIRDDIRALHAYPVASAQGLVKLDLMENPYGLPAELARELGQRLGSLALNRYPPGDPAEFKRRLGEWAGLPAGSALLLGNGSDELIHLLVLACARPDAVILSPAPGFSMYRIIAAQDRCRYVDVALRPDYSLDLPAFLAAIDLHRPAVIFLAYPNNPTGNCFARSDIAAILDAAPGLVVLDEAYLPFAQQTWMDELPRRPNLLVLRTLSSWAWPARAWDTCAARRRSSTRSTRCGPPSTSMSSPSRRSISCSAMPRCSTPRPRRSAPTGAG